MKLTILLVILAIVSAGCLDAFITVTPAEDSSESQQPLEYKSYEVVPGGDVVEVTEDGEEQYDAIDNPPPSEGGRSGPEFDILPPEDN